MRRILGRVRRSDFVGRNAELAQLVSHATGEREGRGLLILLHPLAGVSELLRQGYDELFNQQRDVVPIYFALPQTDTTAVSAAIEFLNTFLLQYIAFQRNEPSLSHSSLTLNDLVQLAPAADLEWIEELVANYNRQRFGEDDRELVRLCLTAPQRVPAGGSRPFVMFDAVQLAAYEDSSIPFATELVRALSFPHSSFVLAGLRRQLLAAVQRAGGNADSHDKLHLDRLVENDARELVASAARREQVTISDETRDLLVQQLECSPFFIVSILQAAREKHLALDSYLACERLFVDELLGGRLHRYFTSVLERMAPEPDLRRRVVRLLCEAIPAGNRAASFEVWRKRLDLEAAEVESILSRLHAQELVNWDGDAVQVETGSIAWSDYLRSRFRLDALREPRALVVADLMADALKRAPQTVARHYRRAAQLPLRELLATFNSQLVPRRLFDYEEFSKLYKGAAPADISNGLDADTELMRLPQVFHTATGVSFSLDLREFGEESSVVAHAFEGATYTDANEIVWLVAEIESKLEADLTLVETWCDRLEALARRSGFVRTQMWLIANEGFSDEASALLREREAFFSSKQQFELLSARLGEASGSPQPSSQSDEIELVVPMGADYELLAANTVEQIARRANFRPEAINQIKTAIVEACINASEHSLSRDRKIYQRFRVENDKLVVTIASRGILPSNLNGQNREQPPDVEESDQRRGWGLKLIRTLMDEVEFERVDEGTSLRMTKYVRKGAG
ncbi:MAG: ATP-binding protein [Acidobacteriota bacterium]|nr:ATP-binding protein [Acidobacteriota bacterium]